MWLTALVTLGSGLVNLYSVMRPSLFGRRTILHEIFPLEFLHVSRYLTMLVGFALVVSSVNIYKRKARALKIVLVLTCLSATFHLAKGPDYQEALFSLVLLAVLLWTRKSFTVKSSLPDWRSAVARLALGIAVAVAYGVAGFWLLDRREFGINFTLPAAVRQTLICLSLVGDPAILPHTRYAHWFLDSLRLMTLTAVGYAGFALFPPALYEFRTHPQERDLATAIVKTYGRSSLDWFKTWPDKSYFFSPSRRCFIAYRVGAHFALALGDPVGPEEEIEETIRGFAQQCEENDWGLGFHQTLPDFLPIYQRLGFKKLKIGDDAIVDLTKFSLQGRGRKDLRNRVNQLEKLGIHIVQYDPPLGNEVLNQIKTVSDEWLRIPGRRERRFSLGWFEASYIRNTPVFGVADGDGRLLAFVNLIPSYRTGEATIDLMRRRSEAPNGVMDYLFVKLFFYEKEKGYERFNLGMAPMAGFQPGEEPSPEERAIHYFFQQLHFLFRFKGLREYKAKFATSWEPRYAIYRHAFDLPRFGRALLAVSEDKGLGVTA